MLAVNQFSGFGGSRIYRPASMVFNGTDEHLTRTLSTSGASTTIFTYSLWVKITGYVSSLANLFSVVSALGADDVIYFELVNGSTVDTFLEQAVNASQTFARRSTIGSGDIAVGQWRHVVVRYDSTQGTAADRIRVYLDGTQLANTGVQNDPTASEVHRLFDNANIHLIGRRNDVADATFFSGRLAFIDILDGVSAAPTDFAFDNGGTWTKKKYTGTRGTHGFILDGSTGVLGADVSGNGQTFTGSNMTSSANLDFSDLPPWAS
jgi:hypothetical protein